jgi:hypothetical protein
MMQSSMWPLGYDIKVFYFFQKKLEVGQVYNQGIPFKTFRILEKCPFHDEINERKIKKWNTLIGVILELYNHVLLNSNWKFDFLPI